MGDQKQFDEALGGDTKVPQNLEYLRFAGARLNELLQMENLLTGNTGPKMIFQNLPIHMRRRTMSYNSMRLPRRLREAHKNQTEKSGLPIKTKRPSRRFRRRPKNLLKEYVRRQKQFVWLETHIWHAKRFHMTERWGYKLPESPCNRSFRSCYRATSGHCLLQDISYYGCIELTGNYNMLIEGFKLSTSSQCGLTFAAQAFLKGNREGSVIVYKKKSFPHNAIGEVNFIWRPVEKDDADTRTIWIFAHAAYYNEILENFLDCFTLKLIDETESESSGNMIVEREAAEFEIANNMETATTNEVVTETSNTLKLSKKSRQRQAKENRMPSKLNKDIKQLETRNIPFTRTKKYVNKNGIQLVELKDTINRFRLTGPLSQAILHKTLKPLKPKRKDIKLRTWFKTNLQKANFKAAHESQIKFWKSIESIQSPAELPPHLVLGLNVVDPRVNRPEKRTKARPELSMEPSCNLADNISQTLSYSVIWDSSMRDHIIQKKLSTFNLNKFRNRYCIVPGEPCDFENVQELPVLLIQRPGSQVSKEKKVGYGSGWDIIIPAGYGMPVWLSLILYGAKSGGLRESKSINLESLKNYLAPDTAAGRLEEQLVYKRKRTAYFALAPNRRINYIKYGINSPFICKWNILLNEWYNNDSNDFYVLRDFRLLGELQEYIQNKKVPKNTDFKSRCLVPVTLTLADKGAPKDFAIICLPKEKEVRKNKKIKLHGTGEPEEPLHDDPHKSERNHSREEHFKLLKRLRQRRIRMKKLLQEKSEKPVRIEKANNQKIIDSQLKKMQQLWLPEDITTVRHQCNFEVMGYVTKGDFSFTEASSVAVGYITLSSIQILMTKLKKNLVLVRDTSSRQYRYAHLKIME